MSLDNLDFGIQWSWDVYVWLGLKCWCWLLAVCVCLLFGDGSYCFELLCLVVLWFQFLLVQLKEIAECKLRVPKLFQFLLVQLKGSSDARLQRPEYLFQFLLVQLKVLSIYLAVWVFYISIPSGTIKRRNNGKRSISRLPISIPSGTIKSESGFSTG